MDPIDTPAQFLEANSWRLFLRLGRLRLILARQGRTEVTGREKCQFCASIIFAVSPSY